MPTPYDETISTLNLKPSTNGRDYEWLYLLCCLGRDHDTDPSTGNPFADLINRCESAAGDCFAVRQLKGMLSTPKNNWDRRPA